MRLAPQSDYRPQLSQCFNRRLNHIAPALAPVVVNVVMLRVLYKQKSTGVFLSRHMRWIRRRSKRTSFAYRTSVCVHQLRHVVYLSGQAFLTVYNNLRRGDNAKLECVAGFHVALTIESNNTLIILCLKERVVARMASIQSTPRLPRVERH